MLDWFRVSDPWLILDGVEDFIDQEFQWSEAFHRYIASKWIWWVDRERLIVVNRLPLSLEHSWELREWNSTSLHHRSVLQSDWRRPSSPLLPGCKAEFEKEPRSS